MSAADEMEFQANCIEAEANVQEELSAERRRRFFEDCGVPMPEFVKSEEDFQQVLDFIRRQGAR